MYLGDSIAPRGAIIAGVGNARRAFEQPRPGVFEWLQDQGGVGPTAAIMLLDTHPDIQDQAMARGGLHNARNPVGRHCRPVPS